MISVESYSKNKVKNHLLHDLGRMEVQCQFCGAVYWKQEKYKSICCHKGTVYIPQYSEYNEKLKKLLINDNDFRLLIRYYNNLFSFATFSANVLGDQDKSIYNLKIQGQICHKTPNYLLSESEEPTCGQFYIYDDNDAIEKKLKSNPNLSINHMKLLTDVMNNNPYSKYLKHLHQISNIQEIPNYRLYFMRKNGSQKHQYNIPSVKECSAIIMSKSGVPADFDLCVYPKREKEINEKYTYMNKLSQHLDPMVFPILFPSGDLCWSTGYKKKPQNFQYPNIIAKKKKIIKRKVLKKIEIKEIEKNDNLSMLQYYQFRLAYRKKFFKNKEQKKMTIQKNQQKRK